MKNLKTEVWKELESYDKAVVDGGKLQQHDLEAVYMLLEVWHHLEKLEGAHHAAMGEGNPHSSMQY